MSVFRRNTDYGLGLELGLGLGLGLGVDNQKSGNRQFAARRNII